jgi:hypothetical protein
MELENGISVTQGKRVSYVNIYSRSSFFNGYVLIKDDGESIVFRKPSIDYQGKVYSFSKNTSGYYNSILANIPIGRYEFDEDSTEDELIIYYKD